MVHHQSACQLTVCFLFFFESLVLLFFLQEIIHSINTYRQNTATRSRRAVSTLPSTPPEVSCIHSKNNKLDHSSCLEMPDRSQRLPKSRKSDLSIHTIPLIRSSHWHCEPLPLPYRQANTARCKAATKDQLEATWRGVRERCTCSLNGSQKSTKLRIPHPYGEEHVLC